MLVLTLAVSSLRVPLAFSRYPSLHNMGALWLLRHLQVCLPAQPYLVELPYFVEPPYFVELRRLAHCAPCGGSLSGLCNGSC